jgi:hypothetical protein
MLLLVAALLVIFLVSMTTYEHMTNKDVISAIKKYGTEDKQTESKKETPTQAPIYGPKVAPVEKTTATATLAKSSTGSSTYPDIYGPDVVASPGEKVKNAKHESDKLDDDTYDYNPDLQKAFPTSGPPQPFLADFSRFQK